MTGQTSTLDEPRIPPRRAGLHASLRLLWSAGRIREDPPIELSREPLSIGRDAGGNHCVLVDPYVSRHHATIEVDIARSVATLHNSSRRGSHVGHVRVDGSMPLEDGAVLTIGHSLLVFHWEPPPVAEVPSATRLRGSAPAMRALRSKLALLAPTESVVSVHGETGTGKELVATLLHELSGRRGAFVPVNCAAIPDALAESTLFGHEAGAFTGAEKSAKGVFRAAEGGTLFLDEIGELSSVMQAKMLRALESGRVMPVGATAETPHGARVVTATHRDLTADVREGRFRADLYARITDFVLEIPPLRARPEDILPLLRHAFRGSSAPLEFSLAKALLLHPWPLNVRELMRIATQLETFGAGKNPLTLDLVEASLARTAGLTPETEQPTPEHEDKQAPERAPSRAELDALLREHAGVVADVARQVGRSRKQVYRWVRSHGLSIEDYRTS